MHFDSNLAAAFAIRRDAFRAKHDYTRVRSIAKLKKDKPGSAMPTLVHGTAIKS
jgi:hypothetical protein